MVLVAYATIKDLGTALIQLYCCSLTCSIELDEYLDQISDI